MTQTITQLECQCLEAIINDLYAEVGFSDIDATDVAARVGLDIKTVRGVLGSLDKKGFIDVSDANDSGFKIIYLCTQHYNLHEAWAEELGLEHKQVSYHLNNGAINLNDMKAVNKMTNVEMSNTITELYGDEANELMEGIRKSGESVAKKRAAMAKLINTKNPDFVEEAEVEVEVKEEDVLTEPQRRVYDKFLEIQPADVWAQHLAEALGENPKSVAIICGGLVKKGFLVVENKTWFYRLAGSIAPENVYGFKKAQKAAEVAASAEEMEIAEAEEVQA